MCILNVATSDIVYLTALSSEACVTLDTICGVWLHISFFLKFSQNICVTNLLFYVVKYIITLPLCWHYYYPLYFTYIITARHLVEISCSVSEGDANSLTKHMKKYCKMVLIIIIVFLAIFYTLSCLPDPYYFHCKTEFFLSQSYQDHSCQ